VRHSHEAVNKIVFIPCFCTLGKQYSNLAVAHFQKKAKKAFFSKKIATLPPFYSQNQVKIIKNSKI